MESLRWLLSKFRHIPGFILKGVAAFLLFLLLLYYPVGVLIFSRIDDDLEFQPPAKYDIEKGSHSVALMQALIEREVDKHHWVPNDPFFYPTAAMVRMPAFQRGILASLGRFSVELADQLGRTRGSSQVDPELEKAAGLLKTAPDIWMFDMSVSWLPATPSEKQYRGAAKLLRSYNERVASGQAIFDRRADNLMETLNRIATDMGSSSAIIDSHIRNTSDTFWDRHAADKFYFIKGRMYADYLLLRQLRYDFADVIREKQLDASWDSMTDSLAEGAKLRHFFVFNGSLSSEFLPNHLAVQGFYLLRARTQLREVSNILLK